MQAARRIAVAITATVCAARAFAAGELMVHPTRIVFEGNTRTAQIDVINSGTMTMTYRISIIRRRMTDKGDFVPVDIPIAGEQFADEMIRYSPRQVTLQPGVAQAVRLQLRRPATIEPGEYRSHILFQALPPPDAPSSASGGAGAELDIRLTAVYSVSIPLIVRHGVTTAAVSIRDIQLQRPAESAPAIAMTLERSGTRSVYGDLTVYHRNGNGPERVIGRANGVAVYTPNPLRHVTLPLPSLAGGVPPGTLRVLFAERPEQHGHVEAEAQATVQ